MGKRSNLILSLIIGLGIFGFFFQRVGTDSISLIFSNIKLFYLSIFFVITTLAFFPTAWRWQIILKAHKKKIPFWHMLKYTISGYAISYVTPMVNAGGEPMRAYMLKKEHGVDLKTGSSSIIIDKLVEFFGTTVFGVVGLVLFLFLPQISSLLKLLLGGAILFGFCVMIILYYRTIKGKGSFSSLFVFFKLHKIARWKNFVSVLEDVEMKMKNFFRKSKKAFVLSFVAYLLYGILAIFEFKFLLLSFGVNESVGTIILSITLFGLANFFPVPAALGFLEAGQTSLFTALRGEGSIGFALSLMIRIRALIFVAIGFAFITYFSGSQINKDYKKNT